MCGFVYSNNRSLYHLKLDEVAARGPDAANTLIHKFGYFFHARLATRETNIIQPAKNNYGILLYNGTEYSLKNNDVDYLLNNLSDDFKNNIEFIKTLNGDFSICWVTNEHILLAKDCFGTKPLYFGIKDDTFITASDELIIKSANVTAIRLEQNTILIFERENLKLENKIKIIDWDIKQGTTKIEDVLEQFERSVLEKCDENCLVKLSSGYDSGAIAACLTKYNKMFNIASYIGTENKDIMEQRMSRHTGKKIIYSHEKFLKQEEKRLKLDFSYFLNLNTKVTDLALLDCNYANKNNIKIIITGLGADELYSDYGFSGHKIKHTSLFGGEFTEDLNLIFPYHDSKFYPLWIDLPISDYVNGIHGIDSRHPFLDKKLFQIWLNTNVEMKNKSYKHWMAEYMKINNYPYAENEKIGLGNSPVKI